MYMAAGVVCQGVLYISGGFNEYESLDEMICYNAARDKWIRQRGRMLNSRGYHVMIESPDDGRLWCVGGVDHPFAGRNVWNIEAWNVELGGWQFVGQVLPVKLFTSTMRLNGLLNERNMLSVSAVTRLPRCEPVEYHADRRMWLEATGTSEKRYEVLEDLEVEKV